jgi:hypothetical protein
MCLCFVIKGTSERAVRYERTQKEMHACMHERTKGFQNEHLSMELIREVSHAWLTELSIEVERKNLCHGILAKKSRIRTRFSSVIRRRTFEENLSIFEFLILPFASQLFQHLSVVQLVKTFYLEVPELCFLWNNFILTHSRNELRVLFWVFRTPSLHLLPSWEQYLKILLNYPTQDDGSNDCRRWRASWSS